MLTSLGRPERSGVGVGVGLRPVAWRGAERLRGSPGLLPQSRLPPRNGPPVLKTTPSATITIPAVAFLSSSGLAVLRPNAQSSAPPVYRLIGATTQESASGAH